MINFTYHSPTKVIFGRQTEETVGDEIVKFGGQKVLIHYGGQSAQKSGLLDRIRGSLKNAGLRYVELGGVQPNPRLALVREGIALSRREGVDFFLAVGGGSVIDSAKAIAYGVSHDFDVWDLFCGKRAASKCAPIGVVLTIAASGSETSYSSVITDGDTKLKRSYNDDIARPKFAVMNPELTFTLPPYQTACGIVDILMHTMERYFTNIRHAELTDRIAEGLMVTVLENGRRVMKRPEDYDARAELMWAGSLSHNGLTGTGRTGDFAAHQIEHELSGMFEVAHGAGLAALWGSWARYVCRHDAARFARFAVEVMGCKMNYHDPEQTAMEGIEALERYFTDIGMPISIPQLGIGEISDAQIEEMAEKCTFYGKRTVGQFVKLEKTGIMEIYKLAAGKPIG
ncbi:MAG: iron-containing alcohol dehydrogenase [Oscillospiraceae bacterium]|jgi:alcohol dehydrogenase YqhD (iron-dependent ADH family)|nr:iron-containing alcohol dehydrogenase [Oscillospiraceae bacterium]